MKRLTSILCLLALLSPITQAASTNAPVRKITKLYVQLGADRAKDRKAAQTKLASISSNHWEAVKTGGLLTLLSSDDPEVTIRTKEVLKSGADAMVFSRKRGFIGISLLENNFAGPNPSLAIASIIPGTAAERESLQAGALILQIDDKAIGPAFGVRQFTSYVGNKGPGATVKLKLDDHGVRKAVEIKLGERPPSGGEASIKEQKERFFEDWLDVQLEEMRRR